MNGRSLTALFAAVVLLVAPTLAVATGPGVADGQTTAVGLDSTIDQPGSAAADRQTTAGDPENPRFETVVPEPELVPGRPQELTIQLLNDAADPGASVETARDVRVTVGSGSSPVEIVSGERLLGPVEDGRPATVTVRVDVPADAPPGTYRLPLAIDYVHRNESGDLVENATTAYATVRIDDRPRFRVVATESDAPIGDTGTMNVTVENVGSATAADAALTLQSTTSSVAFGSAATASQYVGTWEPGERRTLQFDVTVAPSAEQRRYSLQATVAYENPDGQSAQSRPLRLGIVPAPEQTFAVSNVRSDLHVGEEGEVVAEVRNTGERQVDNAVVVFQTNNPTVTAAETQYAVGRLAPGESTTVRFDAAVSDSAEAGPRQFSLRVQYRNENGAQRASDPLDVRVVVGEQRPAFRVEPATATVTAGGSAIVELRVTNNRNETLRDVSAKLFADAPLSAADDEAFVEELPPGESATLTFAVDAAGGAIEKAYPIAVDFRYDDAEGQSHISDTYQVPVEVTVPEDSGGPLNGNLPIAIGAAVVVALVLVGAYLVLGRE